MREELPHRRKSNRIKVVEVLPSRTERGDTVYMHNPTHAYLREKWENLSQDPHLPSMKSTQPANQSHSLG